MVHIPFDKKRIEEFCKKWNIVEFSFFGSVLRDDFRPDSDVDVLVRFGEGASRGLFEFVKIEEDLKALLGRNVDLVERPAVEKSENYIRRRHILSSLVKVYVA